ncbi:Hypothetical protein CINCED_3A022867 [Cinara cedri]|uniref:Uncharacterized protein n=1 Tax=Cinara cedri TaxID=506608 RepID=A0A5E4NNB5_9HEMI|nr:Hypothetical protein CINCED_3A022867 [Cinara cedri]
MGDSLRVLFDISSWKDLARHSVYKLFNFITKISILLELFFDLGLKAYKIQLVQELKPADLPNRHRFSEWVLEKIEENPLFSTNIFFSDEGHFWLNGYVNKQNYRIWAEEQPEEAGGIIGRCFFKNEAKQNVTVNGARYRDMITDYLLPEIEARNLDDIWFQQDGATCLTARETLALLREQFGEQLISRFGPISWPV